MHDIQVKALALVREIEELCVLKAAPDVLASRFVALSKRYTTAHMLSALVHQTMELGRR